MIQLFIIFFLASFIPQFRNYFKKELRKSFIAYGAMLLIVQVIMSLFVFPKLVPLYQQSELGYDFATNVLLLGISLFLSLLMIFLGIKVIKFYKSNTTFYLMFGLLTILSIAIIKIDISAIIQPIYLLTTSFK